MRAGWSEAAAAAAPARNAEMLINSNHVYPLDFAVIIVLTIFIRVGETPRPAPEARVSRLKNDSARPQSCASFLFSFGNKWGRFNQS